MFIYVITAKINHYKYLVHADDLKIYRNRKLVQDCKNLQVDNVAAQEWSESDMELNIQKS
jgi:hypothetical protein